MAERLGSERGHFDAEGWAFAAIVDNSFNRLGSP